MSSLDLIFAAIFITYGYLGYRSGLIRRVVGLCGLYIGILAAYNGGGYVADLLFQSNLHLLESQNRIFGYLIVLIFCALSVETLGVFWHSFLQKAIIPADNKLGAIAGGITALAAVGILAAMLAVASAPSGINDSFQLSLNNDLRHSIAVKGLLVMAQSPLGDLAGPIVPSKNGSLFWQK